MKSIRDERKLSNYREVVIHTSPRRSVVSYRYRLLERFFKSITEVLIRPCIDHSPIVFKRQVSILFAAKTRQLENFLALEEGS